MGREGEWGRESLTRKEVNSDNIEYQNIYISLGLHRVYVVTDYRKIYNDLKHYADIMSCVASMPDA